MQLQAVEQAEIRLERIREAIEALDAERWVSPAMESAWSSFLVAAAGIYAKLEQGAKGKGSSESWFGRVKHERKSDDLLHYIHHARNSDEHGLDPNTSRTGIRAKAVKGARVRENAEGELQSIEVTAGIPVEVRFQPPGLRLLQVKNPRFDVTCDPPSKHLGVPILDQSPENIARLALAHLESIVKQARKLAL